MKRSVTVYTLNAFSRDVRGGNPAGVVLDAQGLSDEEMRAIAAEVGFSETAFLLPSETCDAKVRFFTPTDEVDFCGHATVGAFSLLWQLKEISHGTYTQETLAGELGVTVDASGRVVMDQSLPVFGKTYEPEAIASILRVTPDAIIDPVLPIQEVSTGLTDIFVPVDSEAHLNAVEPDFDAMAAFNETTDTVGFHLFVPQSSPICCRNFAPRYGIDEESATGSSNGALACYLWTHGLKKMDVSFLQGEKMGSPSRLDATVHAHDGAISRIQVGGHASAFATRQMNVNAR